MRESTGSMVGRVDVSAMSQAELSVFEILYSKLELLILLVVQKGISGICNVMPKK